MTDKPADEETETFVQKAVKVGLITIPLMMYVSWAYKKFVPCPRVKSQQASPSLFKKSTTKGKRKSKHDKSRDSRSDKQEHKRRGFKDSRNDEQAKPVDNREKSQDTRLGSANCQDLTWPTANIKCKEPTKDEYMSYLKSSTRECCEPKTKHAKGYCSSTITDCELPDYTKQATRNDPCAEQIKKEKTDAEDSSDVQSETISAEAFDELFEKHFQKCVDDFRQHKEQLENELKDVDHVCESKQKNEEPEINKSGNYLECLKDLNIDKDFDEQRTKENKTNDCETSRNGYLGHLADLNLDKDFECDPNFHSKDSAAQYVVRDYKCKVNQQAAVNRIKSDGNETGGNGYLKCLTDLNIDKHFEDRKEPQNYVENTNEKCCPESEVEGNMTKTDPCTQEVRGRHTENETDWNTYSKAKLDDCGCDPHFNTKDTDKYGTVKGDPCAFETEKEDNTDEDALKNFWHACGPPKGLRTGCQAEGCNPTDKRK